MKAVLLLFTTLALCFVCLNSAQAQDPPTNAFVRIGVDGEFPAGSVSKVGSALITIETGYSNSVIFYTLDGSSPDFNSPVYGGPFVMSNSVIVRALALDVDTFDTVEASPLAVVITSVYTLTLTVGGNGNVVADPPTGPYSSNSVVTLTATPDSGWIFDHWSGDADGSTNVVAVTMDGPRSVEAVFAKLFPVATASTGGGSINVDPLRVDYPSNSVVTLTAIASNDWTFLFWQGAVTGTSNPVNLVVNGPMNVSAVFGTTLATSIVGLGSLHLNATNPIAYGTIVSATALPASGWLFERWAGDAVGGSNPIQLTMNAPRAVQAVFTQEYYPVVASTAGGGTVDVDPAPGPYPSYSEVAITAEPSDGWTFLGWQGDASGTNNPRALLVDGLKNVTAVFGRIVETAVIGSGAVELSPIGLVPYGTVVHAAAVPDAGSYFLQWGSALSGTNSPSEFSMVNTNPVRAVFGALQPGEAALSIRIVGPGGVEVMPRQQVYPAGSMVTLSANPVGVLNQFSGWSGDAAGAENPLVLTLNTSKVVTATFGSIAPALAIVRHGDGIQVSWLVTPRHFELETTTNLFTWSPVALGPLTTNGDTISVNLPATDSQRFFRLRSLQFPLFQFAIFYEDLLEFSTGSPMTVNGRVHANGSIYTGTDSSLTFKDVVTTTGTISSPANNGHSSTWTGPTIFSGNPPSITNVAALRITALGTNNLHAIIERPPAGESPNSAFGKSRLYNQAHVIVLVSNSFTTLRIQTSPNGEVPGTDPVPYVQVVSNSLVSLNGNFPFLNLTNRFFDQREGRSNIVAQIDVTRYAQWLATNSAVAGKFPPASSTYPTILFVADERTTTANQLTVVRLANGRFPPQNGGLGFTVATPNPLYVWGHYNQTNAALLNQTNTTSGTVPCALMSDALTILSSNWIDSRCTSALNNYSTNDAANTTVNAAILTGIVPSAGSASTQFSGGVHNLPRLLEDWYQGGASNQKTLTLNTSIVRLFNSTRATARFRNPSTFPGTSNWYYDPPRRNFCLDPNFADPAKLPPGTPFVLPWLP
jgi:List-Bact-rpt repeat protein/chitobiase/beta-hexosaminidase-like protein